MTQAEVVQFVSELVVAGLPEEWAARAPNEFPAACRFCGDPMLIMLSELNGRVRVAIGHPDPLCADFARRYEDAE